MLLVVLVEPHADIIKSLKASYPDFHQLSPTTFLVATQDTSRQIGDRIGIDETTQGVVFNLSGKISGYANDETYQWLARHMGQPA